jgi:hypothetical protein
MNTGKKVIPLSVEGEGFPVSAFHACSASHTALNRRGSTKMLRNIHQMARTGPRRIPTKHPTTITSAIIPDHESSVFKA